jgi:hypothetical protein
LVVAHRYNLRVHPVTHHAIHRVVIAALQVAVKAHCDAFYSNKYASSVVGIAPQELNRLELKLLLDLEWSVQVTKDDILCILVDTRATQRAVMGGEADDEEFVDGF